MILPVNKLGGGGVQIIVNNNTPAQADVVESQGPDDITQFIVTVGANDILKGGSMADAMTKAFGVKRSGRIL